MRTDRVGHRYPPYRYEVSREKVREYAVAVGERGPEYEADDGPVTAPPTFAASFTLGRAAPTVLTDLEVGDGAAVVHGSQEFRFDRPVRAGDVLRCTPSIAGIVARGGTDVVTLQVDCVDDRTGAAVVQSRSTLLVRPAPEG